MQQIIFKDGVIDFPDNLRTSWMSQPFTTKLILTKLSSRHAESKKSVIAGVVDRALALLSDKVGKIDEGRRFEYTQALIEAIVAQMPASDVRDYLDWYAEDMIEYSDIGNGYDLYNALAAAISVGDDLAMKSLLEEGLPNQQPIGTALCGFPTTVAAGRGQYETLRFLLEGGFRLEGGDYPALERASEAGHEAIVRLLLTPKYGIKRCGSKYEDALLAAARAGQMVIIQILIDYATDLSTTEAMHKMMFTAATHGRTQVIQMLLNAGVPADIQDDSYEYPLQEAALHGRTSVVRLLLANGALGNKYYVSSEALVGAARNGHTETAQVLLDAGADIDAKAWKYRNNPLAAAAVNGEATMVRFLLEKGADLSPTKFGLHGLYTAANKGHEAVVRVLVEAGVDVNGGDIDDSSNPMLNALASGQTGVVRLLRQLGAREVDPLKSDWREQFESGYYPRRRIHE